MLNLDQTPLKYVSVGSEIMAEKESTNVTVTVEGSNDKRCITGRTAQSLQRFKFPKDFA